jgi:hypothetical protein
VPARQAQSTAVSGISSTGVQAQLMLASGTVPTSAIKAATSRAPDRRTRSTGFDLTPAILAPATRGSIRGPGLTDRRP